MAKTVQVSLTVSIVGDGQSFADTYTITSNETAIPALTSFAITTGNNTFTVPSGTLRGVLFMPPANSTVQKVYTVGTFTSIAGCPDWCFIPAVSLSPGVTITVTSLAGFETLQVVCV